MMDQAENLRNMIRRQNQSNIINARVIAVTSGKGGLAVDDFTGSDYSMVLGKDAFPVAGTELADEL